MRVMFVSINKLKSYRPVLPIGMVTVATQVRAAGHEVRCVDLMFEDDEEQVVRREVLAFRPDVVGISIRNVDSLNLLEPAIYTPLALDVAAWTRAVSPDTRIVLGGAGFTTVPEDLMEFVDADYGILGFAEQAMLELLRCLQEGHEPAQVEGVIYPLGDGFHRREPSYDIRYDAVLPPDRALYDPRYFEYTFETHDDVLKVPATIQTKKGCVLKCIFCSNFLIDGPGVLHNSPAAIVDEMERLQAEGMDQFEIVDGVFNIPLHNALALLREMVRRRLRLRWSCMINPGTVNDELIGLLCETGCHEVEFGTDSANDRVLAVLKKNFRQRQVIDVHQRFQRAGIRIMHCCFLAAPGDDPASVRETLDVMERLVPSGDRQGRVYFTFGLRICRGTDLHRLAVEEGILRGDERFLVPKYYAARAVLESDETLVEIQRRVLANQNWYLWWGLSSISLRERIRMSLAENRAIEEQVLAALDRHRRRRAEGLLQIGRGRR